MIGVLKALIDDNKDMKQKYNEIKQELFILRQEKAETLQCVEEIEKTIRETPHEDKT